MPEHTTEMPASPSRAVQLASFGGQLLLNRQRDGKRG
jgi:hypothetical protein